MFSTEFVDIFAIPIENESGRNISCTIKRNFTKVGIRLIH